MDRFLAKFLGSLTTLVFWGIVFPPEIHLPRVHAADREGPTVFSVSQWREDLAYLASKVWILHPDPTIYGPSRSQYRALVKTIHDSIPTLSDQHILKAFLKLHSSLNDAHSGTEWNSIDERLLGRKEIPLKFYCGRNGWFVSAASSENTRFLGWHLTHVGGQEVEDVIDRIKQLVSGDNSINRRTYAGQRLSMPAALSLVDVTNRDDRVNYRLKSPEGLIVDTEIAARLLGTGDILVDASDLSETPLPLWRKNADRDYWFEPIVEHGLVYVQCNRVRNDPNEPMEQFSRRLFAWIESHRATKLVLDLRRNPGGDPEVAWPLINRIAAHETINQNGHFFVIVGRETKSAAPTTAVRLQNLTNAIVVGEPTAGRPNGFGNTYFLTLPNSRIQMRCSMLYMQPTALPDRRPWVEPDLTAELTADDYIHDRDPALKAIIDYKPAQTILEYLGGEEPFIPPTQIVEKLTEFRQIHRNKWVNVEEDLNTLGQRLLTSSRTSDAIAILKLNVRTYPYSWEAHYSLANAFAANDQKLKALDLYQKSFQIMRTVEAAREIEALESEIRPKQKEWQFD